VVKLVLLKPHPIDELSVSRGQGVAEGCLGEYRKTYVSPARMNNSSGCLLLLFEVMQVSFHMAKPFLGLTPSVLYWYSFSSSSSNMMMSRVVSEPGSPAIVVAQMLCRPCPHRAAPRGEYVDRGWSRPNRPAVFKESTKRCSPFWNNLQTWSTSPDTSTFDPDPERRNRKTDCPLFATTCWVCRTRLNSKENDSEVEESMRGMWNDLKVPEAGVQTKIVSLIRTEKKPSRPEKPRIAAEGKVMELFLEVAGGADLEYA